MKKTTLFEDRNNIDNSHLKDIAKSIPVPFYWSNKDCIICGANEHTLEAIGFSGTEEELVGKTVYDLYPKEIADKLIINMKNVMRVNQSIVVCEKILSNGKYRYYDATIAPLHNEEGSVVGTYGLSIETTSIHHAHQLSLKNIKNEIIIKQQEKFNSILSRIAHDIRSPIASLLMLLDDCNDLEEPKRLALRQCAHTINGIAESILDEEALYTSNNKNDHNEAQQPIIVSLLMLQLIESKRYQYRNTNIEFITEIPDENYFIMAKAQLIELKRVLSNVINNAVSSYHGQPGSVLLKLKKFGGKQKVAIIVKDNGCGISAKTLAKIRKAESVSEGKANGHGIGLLHARDVMQYNNGKIAIESLINGGTIVTLSFPTIKAPNYLTTKIDIYPNDRIIIIDDDDAIHSMWDKQLINYAVKREHYYNGHEALKQIVAAPCRDNIVLLTDYDLVDQELTGINIIENASIKRSFLVTHYFDRNDIIRAVKDHKAKLLPKLLVPFIKVVIHPACKSRETDPCNKIRPVVIIDDDVGFTGAFVERFKHRAITVYHTPEELFRHIKSHSTDTLFFIDCDFNNKTDGFTVAQKLYENGFAHLNILSGMVGYLNSSKLFYATMINKTNIARIDEILQ